MDEINPYNLGKLVYEYDQIITIQDLNHLIGELDDLFDKTTLSNDELETFTTILDTLMILQDWLLSHKQMDIRWQGQNDIL